jgi:hypothetical protein
VSDLKRKLSGGASQVYSADFEPCLYAVACQSLGRVMLHRIRLLATSDTLEASIGP